MIRNMPPGMEVYSYGIPGMGDGQPWVPQPQPAQPGVFTYPPPLPRPSSPCHRVPSLAEVIDTLNDACKDDAVLFRELVMKLVKKEL